MSNPSSSPPPYIDQAVTLILVALLFSTGYTYFQRGVWPGLSESFDFSVFYTGSKIILEGHTEHLYDIEWYYSIGSQPYQYFPFFAIILSPLTILPFEQARVVWMLINQLVLLGSAWIVIKNLGVNNIQIILGVLILMLGFGPLDANMYWGQVNAVIMLCILATWLAYKKNRPILCGIMISIGFLIKITPAIIGVYFLYKRSYKVLLGCFYGGLGCLLFSIIMLGGIDEHIAWFTDMLPFLTSAGGMGKGGQVLNQSFLATYIRIAEQGVMPTSYAPMLHLLSEIAVLILCFAFFRVRRLKFDSPEFDLEFAAVSCLMVLMPPTVIVQHYVYILPVYFIFLAFIIREGLGSVPIFICFGLSYALVSLGAFGGSFFSQWPFVVIQSSKLIGMLIIWCTIGCLLLRQRGLLPVWMSRISS